MRRFWIWLFLVLVAGCISTSPNNRKKSPVVTETRPVFNHPKFNVPKIRKPRIIEMKDEREQINISEANRHRAENNTTQPNKTEAPEPNENLNEIDRNKRFDNLVELNNINKETNQFDKIFAMVGAIGLMLVIATGVYFIAKTLF